MANLERTAALSQQIGAPLNGAHRASSHGQRKDQAPLTEELQGPGGRRQITKGLAVLRRAPGIFFAVRATPRGVFGFAR
jgi:hypothetical protein